jgi:hypothetical protein
MSGGRDESGRGCRQVQAGESQTWALKISVCESCTTRRAQAGMRSPRPPFQCIEIR